MTAAIDKTLTFAEAAQALRMSERWLRGWLASNPVDVKGVPFYIPMGRRKEFERADIERIRIRIREIEECRLNCTAANQAGSGITAEQLGRLAADGVFADRPTPKTKKLRRARLPSSKKDTGTVISMVQQQS
jgi:hypothetical protein